MVIGISSPIEAESLEGSSRQRERPPHLDLSTPAIPASPREWTLYLVFRAPEPRLEFSVYPDHRSDAIPRPPLTSYYSQNPRGNTLWTFDT